MAPIAPFVVVLLVTTEGRPAGPNTGGRKGPPDVDSVVASSGSDIGGRVNGVRRGLVFPKSWGNRRRGKRSDDEEDGDISLLNSMLAQGEDDVDVEHRKMADFSDKIDEMVRMNRLIENDSDMFFRKLKRRETEVDNAVTHNLDLFKHSYEKKRGINQDLVESLRSVDAAQDRGFKKAFDKWTLDKAVAEKRQEDDLKNTLGGEGSVTSRITGLGKSIDTNYADLADVFDIMVNGKGIQLGKAGEQVGKRVASFQKDANDYVKIMSGTANTIFEQGKDLTLSQKMFRKELTAADEEITKMGKTVMDHAAKLRERSLRMYVDWAKRAEATVTKNHENAGKDLNEIENEADAVDRDIKKELAYERKAVTKSVKNVLKSSTRAMASGSKLVMADAKMLEKGIDQTTKEQKKQLEGMTESNRALKVNIANSKKGTDTLTKDLRALQKEFKEQVGAGLTQKLAQVDLLSHQNNAAARLGWNDVSKIVETAIKEDNAKVKVKRKATMAATTSAKRDMRSEDITARSEELRMEKAVDKQKTNTESLGEKVDKGAMYAEKAIADVETACTTYEASITKKEDCEKKDGDSRAPEYLWEESPSKCRHTLKNVRDQKTCEKHPGYKWRQDIKRSEQQAESYSIKQLGKLDTALLAPKKGVGPIAEEKRDTLLKQSAFNDPDVIGTFQKQLAQQESHVVSHKNALLRMLEEDNTVAQIADTSRGLVDTRDKFSAVSDDLLNTESKGQAMLTNYVDKQLKTETSAAAAKALEYIMPYEEDMSKSIAGAQEASGRALNNTDTKVSKDFGILKAAASDSADNWYAGDADLKKKDEHVDQELALDNTAFAEDAAEQSEERGGLSNEYDAARVSADGMFAKEKKVVSDAYKKAGQRMDDIVGEAAGEEKKAQAEQNSLVSRDLRRVETEEKERVNVMHGDLARLQEEHGEAVEAMTQGRGKLAYWSSKLQGIESDTISKFVTEFDGLMSASNNMWTDAERGSEEEAALLKGQAIMLEKLLDSAMHHLDADEQADMNAVVAAMNKDMQVVMRTVGLTDEERQSKLRAIQAKAKNEMLSIMATSEKLAPLVKSFQQASMAAGADQLDLVGQLSEEERRNAATQQYAMKEAAKAQEAESARALDDIVGAVMAAEEGQSGVLKELRSEGAVDRAQAGTAGEDGNAALDGVATELERAAANGEAADKAKKQQTAWAAAILKESDETMSNIDTATASQKADLEGALAAEKNRLKMGVLYTAKSREAVLRQLSDLLDQTSKISGDLFVQRAAAAEHLNGHIEQSLDSMTKAGMGGLAEMMRNSLAFSKQMLKQMVDLKLVMWRDMQARNQTGDGGEFMKLRSKLLSFQKKSAAESADLVAQLEAKLAKLGIVGAGSAEHLATFLHQLSFQLANGQADGLEDLMGSIFEQFGLALGDGVDSSSILGGTLKALAHKQKVAHDLLKGVTDSLQKTENRFNEERDRVMGMLSRDQQLQSMSDEEFRDHIRKLQELLGHVASTAPESPNIGRADDAAAEGAETAAAASALETSASFAERVQREAARRQAAVDQQHELERRLKAALERGVRAHVARH